MSPFVGEGGLQMVQLERAQVGEESPTVFQTARCFLDFYFKFKFCKIYCKLVTPLFPNGAPSGK
jgi:hypothetical protein